MCGCTTLAPACFDCVKRAAGKNPCPSFVSPDFQRALADNRGAVETVATVLSVMGASMVSSVVLAPVGVPLVAAGQSLVIIANGCDVSSVMKAHARQVRDGLLVVAAIFGAGAGASALSIAADAGLVSAAALGVCAGIASVCVALAPVFDALSRGQPPSWTTVQASAMALAALGGFQSQVRGALDVVNTLIGDRDFARNAKNAATGATTRTPVRPTADDVNYQLFSTELLTRAKNGGTSATLDRYFSAYVAQTGNLITGGPSAAVTYTVGNIWRAWRSAGHPTTGDGILVVLKRYFGSKTWFPALVAAFAAPGSPLRGTVIPKAPIRSVADRITGPGPGASAPPPPPDEEGGGLGLLIGAGLVLKFLL